MSQSEDIARDDNAEDGGQSFDILVKRRRLASAWTMDFAFSTVETGEKVLRGVMEHSTSKCDVVVILAAFVRIIVSTRFCRLPPPPHLLDIPGQQLGRQLIPSLGLLAGSWHGDHVVISN